MTQYPTEEMIEALREARRMLSYAEREIERLRNQGGLQPKKTAGIYKTIAQIDETMRAKEQSHSPTERKWYPHLDYAGEPMLEGEFRDPPTEATGDDVERVARASRKLLDLINEEGPPAKEWQAIGSAMDELEAAIATLSPNGVSQSAVERAQEQFTEYFVRNYPGPDTIIHNPHWHAPRIFRAALHALATQPDTGLREALEPFAAVADKLEAMQEALQVCANKFWEYVIIHQDKKTSDGDQKAARNRQMAEMCEAALNLNRERG